MKQNLRKHASSETGSQSLVTRSRQDSDNVKERGTNRRSLPAMLSSMRAMKLALGHHLKAALILPLSVPPRRRAWQCFGKDNLCDSCGHYTIQTAVETWFPFSPTCFLLSSIKARVLMAAPQSHFLSLPSCWSLTFHKLFSLQLLYVFHSLSCSPLPSEGKLPLLLQFLFFSHIYVYIYISEHTCTYLGCLVLCHLDTG